MKRLTRNAALGMCIALLMLGGCANQGTQTNETTSENASTESGEYQLTPGAVRTSFLDAEMMSHADLWQNQDDSRVAAVMRKAEAGLPVTIAVIGGSITEGVISHGTLDKEKIHSQKCYASIFREWWEIMFPSSEITFINAGIGGTDSYLGLHRVEADVLSGKPDLVLVEFSVNDGADEFYGNSYKNLVRKIETANGGTAVILLMMSQTNGSNAQSQHMKTGQEYNIPMLSYYGLISYLMQNNIYTAEELSADTVHPSALGHTFTGEMLWNYLNKVYAGMETAKEPEVPAENDLPYANATIQDASVLEPEALGSFVKKQTTSYFPNGWQTTKGEEGIRFKTTFRNLGILYQKTVDGLSGDFDVYVDGEKVGTIHADFSGGWGDAIEGKEFYTSDSEAEHEIEIRKSDSSKGSKLNLLGLLIS